MDERIKDALRRHDIDPAMVVDVSVESVQEQMWSTRAPWPAGGTYGGPQRDFRDVAVAHRVTETVTIDVVGTHPGASHTITSPEGQQSRVVFVDEGQWIFHE